MRLALTRIKISHFNLNGMDWSFKSCRNGMTTPFLPEWNDHSIPAGMEWSHSILAGMK